MDVIKYDDGISVVIPAYNEEKRIKNTLDDIVGYIHTHNMNNIEVIVVVDPNSSNIKDETAKIVSEYEKAYPNVIKTHFNNQRVGKGGAIKKGIKLAKYSIVAYADADKSSSFEEVMKLVNAIDGVDCSIGIRKTRDDPFLRRFASKGYLSIAKLLFDLPYEDLQCGYKAFKHSALDEVISSIAINDFVFDLDLLFKLHSKGFAIKSVPIKWSSNKVDSKISFMTILKMGVSLVGLRLLNSPFKHLIPFFVITFYNKTLGKY